MTRLFISTKTVTLAMRCRDVLRKHGFAAQVEKRMSLVQNGCGHGVSVKGEKKEILRVLTQNNVSVMKIYEL